MSGERWDSSVFGVAVTGGIGSGKSAVSDRLVAYGAKLIDADVVAREVVQPGGPAFEPLIERFGEGVRAPDGTIDRPALAEIAFGDPAALADLNSITHPAIGKRMEELRDELMTTDHVVVYAIPLLRKAHRESLGLDAVVVVDCPTEVAVDRLVNDRGMDRQDALARIAAQIGREERLGGADYVVDNSSSIQDLDGAVAALWAWIEDRRAAPDA